MDQKQGQNALENNDVDLALMDVQLPDGDDMNFCKDLKHIKDVPVIIVSEAHDNDIDEIEGLLACADDYIRKSRLNEPILLARIEVALRKRTMKMRSDTISSGQFELDRNRGVLNTGTDQWDLTPIECKLVEKLMINADVIVPYDNLLWHLYDVDSPSDISALQTNMSRLKLKITGGSKGSYPVESVRGVGYKWNSAKAQ